MGGMADGNDKAFQSTIFLSWADMSKRAKMENEICKEYGYREKIDAAQKKLFEYKQAQLGNIKGVMARTAQEGDFQIMTACITALLDEVDDVKKKSGHHASMNDLESKFKNYADASAGNAKKGLARMNAGNEEAAKSMALNSWVAFVEDYKKDKKMNDIVKAKEKAVEEFKKKTEGWCPECARANDGFQ